MSVTASDEPRDGFNKYRCHKVVEAGRIVEIVPAGAYVGDEERSVLRYWKDGMLSRYTPTVGDYWVCYEDGYQSLSPKKAFEEGYHLFEPEL